MLSCLQSSLCSCSSAVLFGPFWARATHVVELGPVRVGKFPYHLPAAFHQSGYCTSDHLTWASRTGSLQQTPIGFYSVRVSGVFPRCVELRLSGFVRVCAGGTTPAPPWNGDIARANEGEPGREPTNAE
jgi:hypothetical protein